MRIASKIATVALTGALAATMVACGGKKEPAKPADTESTTESVAKDVETGLDAGTEAAQDATGTATTTGTGAYAYDYTPGTVNTIMSEDGTTPLVPDFAITGLIMTGNQTEGEGDGLLADGYKMTGLANEFNLNEWISFYLDDATIASAGIDTSIVAVPHREASEYTTMPYDQLVKTANENGGFIIDVIPDTVEKVESKNYVGNAYVNMDTGKAGLWDVLFCKSGKPAQYLCVNLNPSA